MVCVGEVGRGQAALLHVVLPLELDLALAIEVVFGSAEVGAKVGIGRLSRLVLCSAEIEHTLDDNCGENDRGAYKYQGNLIL